MNAAEKKIFKNYILAYLNGYYLFTTFSFTGDMNYKSFKIQKAIQYFKIIRLVFALKWFFKYLLLPFETLISVTIVIVEFIYCSIVYPFYSEKCFKNSILLLTRGEKKVQELLNRASIDLDSIQLITIPFLPIKQDYAGINNTSSVLSGISYWDIFNSFLLSIRMVFFLKNKYGHRDCLFRSYSSFYFFIASSYFRKIDLSNTVVYTATFDRWAYLFANLNNKVIFIQHGQLSINKPSFFIIKVGSPTVAYYINQSQAVRCNDLLFKNTPEMHILKGLEFNSAEKLIQNERQNVLLICELRYFDIENQIVKRLVDLDKFNVYIKPHPLDPFEMYRSYLIYPNVSLLKKDDYLKADFVISYESTLAILYEEAGVRVFRYDILGKDTILDMLPTL